MLSFAGTIHPVVPVHDTGVLRRLDYDFGGVTVSGGAVRLGACRSGT